MPKLPPVGVEEVLDQETGIRRFDPGPRLTPDDGGGVRYKPKSPEVLDIETIYRAHNPVSEEVAASVWPQLFTNPPTLSPN